MVDFAAGNDAQREIGIALAAIAPEGWTDCSAVYWEVGPVSEVAVTATVEGHTVGVPYAPDDLIDAFEDLREATAEHGKGAWYTARFRLTPDLVLDGEFDWNNPPPSSWEVTPSAYVDDLDRYPRDEAHQPDWLRAKLTASATTRPPTA